MTRVKLLMAALVGHHNYAPGEVVLVPDNRARTMVAEGVAEMDESAGAEGEGPKGGHANEDANPLGDVLTPLPHGEIPINPADALAPHVGDNPGLNKLVEVVGKKDEVSPAGRASTIHPVPTLDVASQEAIDQSHREANPAKAKPAPAREGEGEGDLTTATGGPAVVGRPGKAAPMNKAAPAKGETATLTNPPNAST